MHHAVLAAVSGCCPPLQGRFLTRYSPVRHFPLFPLDESSFHRFSFDLHVLSTPPAFVLSQDQTLHKIYEELNQALNYLLKKLPIAMLFIPIDVLIKKLLLLLTSGLIMLHDYLHCLVFKEQSLSHSSEVPVASSDSFILSLSDLLVKNFFEVFFEAFRNSSVPRQSRLRYTVSCPCLSATCIILHESRAYVNTFLSFS